MPTAAKGYRGEILETVDSRKWNASRAARLGFLIGMGCEAARIAKDPLIASTMASVQRQANRLGLSFREADEMGKMVLPLQTTEQLDIAAAKRGLTREGIIRLMLLVVGREPVLIDNILDDGAC